VLQQDVEERLAPQLGVLVRLGEMPGYDTCPEPRLADVVDVVSGQQAQEVALASSVEPEDPDALVEDDLGVERLDDAGEPEALDHHRPLAGATTFELDGDGLVLGALAWRLG